MVLAFENKSLRQICEQPDIAEQELGTASQKLLQNRLSDIRAANSVLDLVVGNPRARPPAGSSYLINIGKEFTLELVPNHTTPRINAEGYVDWHKVRRIKLIGITKN